MKCVDDFNLGGSDLYREVALAKNHIPIIAVDIDRLGPRSKG